jgi:hypothetical protein
MTREEKQLLLQDLCARLPYGVCVHVRYKTGEPCYGKLTPRDIQWFIDSNIEVIKPYLRPMSSMTEEEDNERKQLGISCAIKGNDNHERIFDGFGNESVDTQLKALDWLNAHNFDYRGLIEKGLALEAPEGMYN